MATNPNFTTTPLLAIAPVFVANTARDGTGAVVTVHTVGANGARIDNIEAKANNATTAGMLRLFLRLAIGGTWALWREMPVQDIAVDATTEAWEAGIDFPAGIPLPAGAQIGASTHVGEPFFVMVHGGEL